MYSLATLLTLAHSWRLKGHNYDQNTEKLENPPLFLTATGSASDSWAAYVKSKQCGFF